MTDQVPQPGPDEADAEAGILEDDQSVPTETTRTGAAAVDEVLDEIDRLDSLPLEEHPAAFERAHDSLRSALDAEPGDPA